MAGSKTYIKLHDGLPDHPKIDPLSDKAFRLLIESWCWCSRQLTDGAMPAKMWATRGTKASRAELERAGLVELPEKDLVVFHDYLEWQTSAAEVQAIRERNAANGRRGGLAKAKRAASDLLGESLSETLASATTASTTEERPPAFIGSSGSSEMVAAVTTTNESPQSDESSSREVAPLPDIEDQHRLAQFLAAGLPSARAI